MGAAHLGLPLPKVAATVKLLVDGNTILDSSRGIHLGLLEGDHSGGMVRNNFIRWDPDAPYAVDVGI